MANLGASVPNLSTSYKDMGDSALPLQISTPQYQYNHSTILTTCLALQLILRLHHNSLCQRQHHHHHHHTIMSSTSKPNTSKPSGSGTTVKGGANSTGPVFF
ncbi:hypothetical protein PTI98_013647 [Pleurotus ostreatus]|nr:hypothetical protein PTI98_013647 [Pleurotus ostreatus]